MNIENVDLDLVLSESLTTYGSYMGQNAFGVRATVRKTLRLDKAVYEGEGQYNEAFWPTADKNEKLGSIPMTVEQAKALKAASKAAIVIVPKWPFYAEDTKRWEPNLESLTDESNTEQVIVADIRCELLLAADNRVVAAYSTR